MFFKGIEICCPDCKGEFHHRQQPDSQLLCKSCGRDFPVIFDIPDLRIFPDPYIDMESDRAKGLRLEARFEELNFEQLIDYYYSITSVVPAKHARQYKRGLLSGVARAEGALASWENISEKGQESRTEGLLEIGCGTAPLLVAAAPFFSSLVGVDIALRWLVVAKKRLVEAGLDVPLICACAEALPFPDAVFDRVVADSVIEHVIDQEQTFAECYRVMRPSGHLFVATPNRYSLGPDPHVGIWAGSLLPKPVLSTYVRWQGGIPPKRRLLSARSLAKLIHSAGFRANRIQLPEVSDGQRRHLGKAMNLLVNLYQTAKNLPISRQLLFFIGPLLHAVAEKPHISAPSQR
jgi:ubiquinone/menaquinone biosynthesis C-methylase UbiE/uncharacterized protein YbaR (Trm112 family)